MSSEGVELALVRQQLAEAQGTLQAIRRGEVDAVLVEVGGNDEVYALEPADLPYREFIEQMAEGAVSLDGAGAIIYCNRFFCGLVGATPEQLIGRPFADHLEPESREPFERALAQRGSFEIAVRLGQAGEALPARLTGVATGTRRRRINIVVSDERIRDRLRRVTRARDAAESASHAKDRFLAVLGHELRNPLAALTSSVDLLRSASVPAASHPAIHTSMARQLTQLRSLIDDLLDLTRVAQGKIVLRPEPVTLRQVIAQVVESLRDAAAARHHEVAIDDVPDDVLVVADRTRLEQIVVNIVSNAIKYTPPNGRVTIGAALAGEDVVLEVTDTGVGMTPTQTEQVFEPFVQLGEPGDGGLGIGLALVRQLVELHGGEVRAESPGLGRGSTFRVVMPRGRPLPTVPVASSRAELPPGLRVLVVDDNEDAAMLLAMVLETRGVVAESVYSGAAVLPAVERGAPALVLLDLGLPDISGYDVARELRRRGFQRTVIIALTGFSHDEARARVVDAGFDGHLVKPITFEQLAATVERFADRLR